MLFHVHGTVTLPLVPTDEEIKLLYVHMYVLKCSCVSHACTSAMPICKSYFAIHSWSQIRETLVLCKFGAIRYYMFCHGHAQFDTISPPLVAHTFLVLLHRKIVGLSETRRGYKAPCQEL